MGGLKHLSDEVFDEELFADGVDVDEVAAQPLTALLSGVERHCRVDQRVARMVHASPRQHRPARLVYEQQGRLNQWAHWARAQGPRIFFLFEGPPTGCGEIIF